ncbi:MAG TPA: hypothetical protein VJJ24_01300 [Candidatus Paceibacterota bacterium]
MAHKIQKKENIEILLKSHIRKSDTEFRNVHKIIEELARSTKDGFDTVNKQFGDVNAQFDGVNKQFQTMFEGMRLMQDDIKDIKRATGPIVQMLGQHDMGMQKLDERVRRLERKAGIAK